VQDSANLSATRISVCSSADDASVVTVSAAMVPASVSAVKNSIEVHYKHIATGPEVATVPNFFCAPPPKKKINPTNAILTVIVL